MSKKKIIIIKNIIITVVIWIIAVIWYILGPVYAVIVDEVAITIVEVLNVPNINGHLLAFGINAVILIGSSILYFLIAKALIKKFTKSDEISAKIKWKSSPQTDQELWCLAVYRIWGTFRGCPEYIGGVLHTDIALEQEIMERDWGICNAEECITMVGKLIFDTVEKPERAWDLCRAMQILGNCYAAQLFSRKILNEYSVKVAFVIQHEFSNWEELEENYLLGYADWANRIYKEKAPNHIKYRIECHKKIQQSNSIVDVRNIDWHLNFTESPTKLSKKDILSK
ncbi:hypothetical protein AN639_04580 [Candidatus Epulonipiscium fishelsonii]|uniref:Uncharacterized protein n=1 Tax=Candidatus Epulonipiscium fishelsonii TaxID=77094 RepID=A0ACC8XF22_9FIRM|nr:hypothetical protein AN639_04580 [Epulopiscium sp. SCG-B05WGA-EpuloA1]ONI41935.1 hypothetical protein AN396_02745 [Epulopiscium sp. SCG-B11WGA-EpuloA1]